ncbi:homeobox-leucine zipper protein ROC6-like [Hibiscus syriacus]|uniref:homeobox-leucine zipper protein ROC6-like n=1 Tax=Hibiscus syriacus TaxID=106335 RepID=UPI0019210B66|nr:homeobox-leucine zipper protein ROC6-like [Hibiscus syriacus]
MFPCLIASAVTVGALSTGTRGTRDNALQVRFTHGVWAVVDVSIDPSNAANLHMFANCRRLPSGCVIQDIDNKYSKVIAIVMSSKVWFRYLFANDHSYKFLNASLHGSNTRNTMRAKSTIFCIRYTVSVSASAHKGGSPLSKDCRRMALLMSPYINEGNACLFTSDTCYFVPGITAACRISVLKLVRRMTYNFLACICALSERKGMGGPEWYPGYPRQPLKFLLQQQVHVETPQN